MKQFLFFCIVLLVSPAIFAAQQLALKGSIGKYPIEMELSLEKTSPLEATLAGRYRYQGKTAYLDLSGALLGGGLIHLTESYEGEETGNFYLEVSENALQGTWLGGSKYHEVSLDIVKGGIDPEDYSLDRLTEQTSTDMEGSYATAVYFLNDMWFSEENPSLETGFNGGVVTARDLGSGKMEFAFQLVCGPTYHLAYFRGEAEQTGPLEYTFNAPTEYGEEPCHLVFTFSEGKLSIEQKSPSWECGFGARAYADGEYQKVSDQVVESEDGPLLQDVFDAR